MNEKSPHLGIAQLLASRGRGDDTMLMHMRPDEIAYIQSEMAKQGKQMTINPDTGLPEAGGWEWWTEHVTEPLAKSGVGPALAGAGLGAAGFSPTASGFIVGAYETISEGSLEDGFTAGLSAYGGNQIYNLGKDAFNEVKGRWDQFKQGWNSDASSLTPYTKTTPHTPVMTNNGLGVATDNPNVFIDQDGNYFQGTQTGPVSVGTPVDGSANLYESTSGAQPGDFVSTPEEMSKQLGTPVTIDAKLAAEHPEYLTPETWYVDQTVAPKNNPWIPDFLEDSRLGRGLSAMQQPLQTGQAPQGQGQAPQGQGQAPQGQGQAPQGQGQAPQGQGMDFGTAWGLAQTNTRAKRAEEEANKAAADDAAAREKAQLPPYHYQNKVGYHQVRNPDYGKVPGARMFFQYYDKGVTGPSYTGPGQGGVRDMTPGELQNYQQTGQFTPGLATGGLSNLLKKKVLLTAV